MVLVLTSLFSCGCVVGFSRLRLRRLGETKLS